MNKIYKVLKNHSTGCMVVVSELAKGAKKSSKAKLASLLLLGALSTQAYAVVGIPQGYDPAVNNDKSGSITINGAGSTLDLGIGDGLNSAQTGEEVKKHAITTTDSINSLYQTKYIDVKNATNNFNQVQNAFNNGTATQAELTLAQNALQQAQDKAAAISDDKFKINDPLGLIGSNTSGITISTKDIEYKDPITGKTLTISGQGIITETTSGSGMSGGPISVGFDEKTPSDDQYKDMELVVISGSGTDVTIINSKENDNDNDNDTLNAIGKQNSGVIKLNDGANLTFATDVSYYTGSSNKSVSVEFNEPANGYTSHDEKTLYKVNYKGTVSTVLGNRTINSAADVNAFNAELIQYIQNNEQVRLDYPNPEAMKAFYDSQMQGLYSTSLIGSYSVDFSLSNEELAQLAVEQGLEDEFNNKVTLADTGKDIGLEQTIYNSFVTVNGSGSVVTVNQGVTVDGKTSAGYIIKADNKTSGVDDNNIFQIDGTLKGNGLDYVILANNAEVYVSSTGVIDGNVSVKTGNKSASNGATNLVDNAGKITGKVTIDKGNVNNHAGGTIGSIEGFDYVTVNNEIGASVNGKISFGNSGKLDNFGSIGGAVSTGDNANIINHDSAIIAAGISTGKNANIINQTGATIVGGIVAYEQSTVNNELGAVVGGVVVVSGNGANFQNDGVAGGAYAADGALAINNNTLVGDGVVGINGAATVVNDGDIYIGYQYDKDQEKPVVKGSNSDGYTAINISGNGSEFVNNQNVYVSSTQHDVNVISIANGGIYTDKSDTVIILNNEDNAITGIDKNKGNDNRVFYINGGDSKAVINGKTQLNDAGSTGIWIQNGGEVTLNGTIALNGKNVTEGTTEYQVRNFGAWVEGTNSKLIMNGDSSINLNSDRAIGVHIRDGASAEINDNAAITFSDKENQIGFLISGIKNPSSIEYNSSKNLELNGKGSVLFRIERGSVFNSDTINSSNPSLSILDSNGTEDSTLMVITTGGVATGASNKTTANLDGFTLNVSGKNAKGISIEGGATATITKDTKIALTGDGAILAKIDGNYYDLNGVVDNTYKGASYLDSSANLTTDTSSVNGQIVTGQNSVGYYVTNGGTLDHKGSINFDAPSKNNIGVKIDSGGTLVSEQGSFIKVHGTAVEISGSNSLATINNIDNGDDPVIWAVGGAGNNSDSAYHVKDKASLKLTGSGVTKAQGTAHGILVDGATQIVLDGSFIDLYDNNSNSSTGNGIENRSALTNIQFTNNAQINVKDGYGIHSSVGLTQSSQTAGIINVYGSGTGIRFENIDPTNGDVLGTTDNAINNTGYENVVINVYEEDGHGIYVDSSKSVNTSASVNIISKTGQSALEIKGTTEVASQSGKLHSANNNSVIVDLNNGYVNTFTNNGELLFGDFTQDSSGLNIFTAQDKETAKNSYAIKTAATEHGLNFTNGTNGKINGTVELLGYGTQADPTDKTKGNTVTLIGEGNVFRTGDGDDKFIVHKVVGDDLGGADQVKQFTQLDGGNGDDQVTFTNQSDFTINKDETIKNIEYFALDNKSKVTLNDLTTVDGLNTGVTTYDIIDIDSILTYKWSDSNTSFDRLLSGKGTFKVDFQNLDSKGKPTNEFAFDKTTNTGSFTGTLELTNTKYVLNDTINNNNTSALTNAVLKASDKSYVQVGQGDQNIGGLTFNGGTVDFGKIDIADEISDNHITVTDLVLESGNVQIDVTGSVYNPGAPTSLPLLEQDDGTVFTQLVAAEPGHVSGGAINIDIDRTKIKLVDKDGNEIDSETKSDLVQNGEVVARATYNTRLTKGENSDGLYVGYGLTQVELKVKNGTNGVGNALILDATNSDPTKPSTSDLDALVTDFDNGDGSFTYGDLQIRGDKAVTLSGSNTYHGSTFVKDTSTLVSGVDSALGNTRLLQLDTNTTFDLNGKKQTIGSLITALNSLVNINGGELTISGVDGTDSSAALNSITEAETLTGSGSLTVGDNSLTTIGNDIANVTINGDNSTLNATVTNAINGKVTMNSQGGLGQNILTNNGVLNLNFANDSVLTNSILNGNGILNKNGVGSLTFTLAQAKDYSGETNINQGSIIFNGDNNATTDSYATRQVNIASGASFIGLNNVVLAGNVKNSGDFYVGMNSGDITTVNQNTVTVQNYEGVAGSKLFFNAYINDVDLNGDADDSPINKLIINGDSSGTSVVTVNNNLGGLAAKTINGIAIIDVNGQSDAEFTQAGRVVAGAYEYKLQRSASNTNNWVLVSDLTVRPEVGGYIGNLSSANNLFNLRLHDRLGETQYTDLLTGEESVTSMWLRHQYGYNKYTAGGGDLSVKDNWNITQLGGDIAQWSSDGLNRLHLGIMAGYGRSKTKSVASIDGTRSDSTIDGYSYGVYATWYDNDQDKTGLYIDTWALWNDFDTSVSGKEFSEKYSLQGLTASIESGYSFKTGELGNYDVWLQPKAQVIWGNVKADDFTETNGTRVSFNSGNLQTRLGLRASLLTNAEMQAATNQSGQLFIEANWLHNTKLYNVTLNNELTVGQDGARNIGELKLGIEGNINKNTNIWFNIAGQKGDHDYENASVMLGLKYSF